LGAGGTLVLLAGRGPDIKIGYTDQLGDDRREDTCIGDTPV